jgi:hypothetical protein
MPAFHHLLRRSVSNALLLAAAAVLLFEEWLWTETTEAAARVGRWPGIAQVERWIMQRPPWQACTLFALPVLVIFPVKALGLYVIARGDISLGVAVFVFAKVLATGVFARLYQLTEPAITRFRWVRRARDAFLRGRAFVHAWLDARPTYRRARVQIVRHSARLPTRYRAAYRMQRQRRAIARSIAAVRSGSAVPASRSLVWVRTARGHDGHASRRRAHRRTAH